MRMMFSVVLLLAVSAVASLSAHVTVSPLQSIPGATQKYELRVHNEGKVAATSIDLEIPDGVRDQNTRRNRVGSQRVGERLAVVHLRNSADRKQYDRFGPHARAPGHDGMTKFMGQNGTEDDPDQGKSAPFVRRTVRSVLGVPDEER